MNYYYDSFNPSDVSLGFSDIAVVPQVTADDDSISSMMFPAKYEAPLDVFQLEDFGVPSHDMESLDLPDLPDISFAVPSIPDIDAAVPEVPAGKTHVAELGEMIPNSLPDLIMESDGEDTSQLDAAVPVIPLPSPRPRTSNHGYGKSAFAYSDDWESDSAESDDEYVAPRRGKRASRRTLAKASVGAEEPDNLTREERVARWLEKKKRRVFKKTVRYESRKQYADKRPRIKGRFVAPEIYAEYMANQASQVVPSK
jgi:hypothetical protein